MENDAGGSGYKDVAVEPEETAAQVDRAYGESKFVVDDGVMWRRRALELEKELSVARLMFQQCRADTIRACIRTIGEDANAVRASAQELYSADDKAHRVSEAIGMLRSIRVLNAMNPTAPSQELTAATA